MSAISVRLTDHARSSLTAKRADRRNQADGPGDEEVVGFVGHQEG